jgi:hypothetical protein
MRITPCHLAALPLLLAAAPAPPLLPGLWEDRLVLAIDSANGSAALGHQLQAKLPAPQPRRDCHTAADLADPRALFLAGAEQSCRFARFVMADGRIEATGDCADGHGLTMHVSGTGSYSATGYVFAFTGTGTAGKTALAFHGRDEARRVDACPVAEDQAVTHL